MATVKMGTSATSQLEAGASIVAAARIVDTRLIKGRLAAFDRAQRAYSAAHDKVHVAEVHLGAAQARLGELKVDQDEAVDAMARALIGDRQPRTNPFAAFGPVPPGALMALPAADEAKAIRQLVSAIQRAKSASKPTLQAAQSAAKTAGAVEQELARIDTLQGAVREARHTRDAVAQTWATELAALKRGARAAADDGAPHLYSTLFDRPNRPNGKSAKPTPAPVPPPAPEPMPNAVS